MSDATYAADDMVQSDQFGIGIVRSDMGPTVLVRFGDRIEECDRKSLHRVDTPFQALELREWQSPQRVIARVQAASILSTNDTWGVFSRSRIELLPHQLWVCRRVLERWPTRWLVADDVGLGKTIEAGLILWPLLSRRTVSRLLILCPASLVEQWQVRLRDMFDIRLTRYHPDLDTPRSDFWGMHTQVVASVQTLRLDRGGRLQRMLEADPWDLVMVDEAHHLNADEQAGPTLGYKLVERLVEGKRVGSMVFFTGTPHHGKDFGFWSLLHLLRPDLFDPLEPSSKQLRLLSQVMIRNNKQNVTDLHGKRLFQQPKVDTETYTYSETEARFYQMLTDFIVRGETYASGLPGADGRAVMLVLIAMQKLASSSVAAIRRALKRRLGRVLQARAKLTAQEAKRGQDRRAELAEYEEATSTSDLDRTSQLEEEVIADWVGLQLMADEEPRLRELIAAADAITDETKIGKILSIVRKRFYDRSVLFFTEYKATQSLLMSALIHEFGDDCVTFINGDERAEEVVDSQERVRTLTERREAAAERFNSGAVRFLVSTEAGGEGIDLQEKCHSLIHVDLPWNPMRMHQRVGRLNRYGQNERVEVVSLRNPDTVEALIWDKLNNKIENIMLALGEVMDEPEDLLQLVLGMTSPALFRELFAQAHNVSREALSDWFDTRSAQFGGKDAVQTVKELVGFSARFDFQHSSEQIPNADLDSLRPFFRLMVGLNQRQVREEDGHLSFKTPDAWMEDPAVRQVYEDLSFDRSNRGKEAAQRVVGVGHRAFDQAIHQANGYTDSVAAISADALAKPLIVFTISDRVTTEVTMVRSITVGVELTDGVTPRILLDWELVQRLNEVLTKGGSRRLRTSGTPPRAGTVLPQLGLAEQAVEAAIPGLDLPFKMPVVATLAVFWPSAEVTPEDDLEGTPIAAATLPPLRSLSLLSRGPYDRDAQ